MSKWISVKDKMPEEYDSIFTKFVDTAKWDKHMWRKQSDEVIVVIKFEDNKRRVSTRRTRDGLWKPNSSFVKETVTHWMPLPEPPKEKHS